MGEHIKNIVIAGKVLLNHSPIHLSSVGDAVKVTTAFEQESFSFYYLS